MNTIEEIARIRIARNERGQREAERAGEEAMNAKLERMRAEEAQELGLGLGAPERVESGLRAAQAAAPGISEAQRVAAALRQKVEREKNTITLPDGSAFVVDPKDAFGTANRLAAAIHDIESKAAMQELGALLKERALETKARMAAERASEARGTANSGFSPRARALILRMGFNESEVRKMEADAAAQVAAQAR